MKRTIFLLLSAIGLQPSPFLEAATTISATNKHAYGANIGWLNAAGDVANGAVIGEYVCSGYIWGANVGWIHLGDGSPANSIQYQNNSATDFGVNHDGLGNLFGLAYGANIGWIIFGTNGAPRVDLKTGALSGYAYGANCGWISLSNAFAHVQTDSLQSGPDSDGDGITDAWELSYTNTLTALSNTTDTDGDGFSDLNEHLADTNPLDAGDFLRITDFFAAPGGTMADVTWLSRPTRCYFIEQRLNLNTGFPWFDSGLGLIAPDDATTTRTVTGTNAPMRFYRVEAVKPLSP